MTTLQIILLIIFCLGVIQVLIMRRSKKYWDKKNESAEMEWREMKIVSDELLVIKSSLKLSDKDTAHW